MPKYMLIARYTAEGAKGVLKDGGTKRRKVAEEVIKGIGGKLESFYFSFGSDDAFVVFDAPDAATSAATSLVIGASGAVQTRTVVLITPEEIDDAAKKSKSVDYKPPGE